MAQRPFTFIKRKRKDGKLVYYVRFRLANGLRSNAKCTGQTSKGAAETWATNYLKRGQIVERENITLEQFSKNFFNWTGDWATDKRVSGKRISRRQCADNAALLKNHILPALGKKKLTELSKSKIRIFRNTLFKSGLSGDRINKTLSCIKAILAAAEEKSLIQGIPKIDRAASNYALRGILKPDEVQKLFSIEWPNIRAFTANLTAAVTGLRQGEILGLQWQSIQSGHLVITRSWNQRMNTLNKTTKTGKKRYVPIPGKLLELFTRLHDQSPWQSPEAFIFFTPNSNNRPMQGRLATRGLYDALKRIGIKREEREARKLDFHSWRHWFNSMLINNRVPIQKVQAVTGHLTDSMTANYYHPDDMADVRAIQETLLINSN